MNKTFCMLSIMFALVLASTTTADEPTEKPEWNIWIGEELPTGEIARGARSEFSDRIDETGRYTACWALPDVVFYGVGGLKATEEMVANLAKRVPKDVAQKFQDELVCVTISQFSESDQSSVDTRLELSRFEDGKAKLAGSMARTFRNEHLYEAFPKTWIQFIRD